MISFPNIDPVIVSVGPFAIRWYSLAYVAGILLGIKYIRFVNNKFKLNLTEKHLEAIILWLVIAIILGGRIGYILFYNTKYYFNNPLEILKTWHGGMSFHGGIIGITIATFLFCRKYKLDFLKVTDLLTTASGIGVFFGRIANFINGELYGRVTNVSWGIIFPDAGPYPRHPSQLYEAFFEGMVPFIILNYFIFKKNYLLKPGIISALFLILYGVARILIEFSRQPDAHIGFLWDYFTLGQILTIPLILVGCYVICTSKTRS